MQRLADFVIASATKQSRLEIGFLGAEGQSEIPSLRGAPRRSDLTPMRVIASAAKQSQSINPFIRSGGIAVIPVPTGIQTGRVCVRSEGCFRHSRQRSEARASSSGNPGFSALCSELQKPDAIATGVP